MREEIIKLISEILEISEEQLVANLDSKEVWDSFQRVEIVFALEDEHGIYLSDEEMKELLSPGALINKVCEKE